ncbi:DgyrCDS7641 [Dimorphilus gyrociliatus]|uniref:DgyrCDS7641 n=1 Tax=Dimorphilus gyrociliatus TaxID=2664684 RepID=A0A7I8VRM4_9ANNE|nr:DgyrCDS7641 [Dimorphilus gyrociliatus]
MSDNNPLEVFNSQSKTLLEKWNIPSHVKPTFDKEGRCNVHNLTGSARTVQMTWQADKSLKDGARYNYVVLQTFIPEFEEFAFEINVSLPNESNKRRLFFTTNAKDMKRETFHARIPLGIVKRKTWLNLCVDVISFMKLWNEENFNAIENLSISANCKLRRIFVLKPNTTNTESSASSDIRIPKHFEYSHSLNHETQLIDYFCIVREYGSIELRIGSGEMKQPHPPSTMPNQKPRPGRKVKSGGKGKATSAQDENKNLSEELSDVIDTLNKGDKINKTSDTDEKSEPTLYTYSSQPVAVQRKSPSTKAIRNRQVFKQNIKIDDNDFVSDSDGDSDKERRHKDDKCQEKPKRTMLKRSVKKNTLKLSSYNNVVQQKKPTDAKLSVQEYTTVGSFEIDSIEADIIRAMQKEDEETYQSNNFERFKDHTFGKDPEEDHFVETNNHLLVQDVHLYKDEIKDQSGRWSTDFFSQSHVRNDLREMNKKHSSGPVKQNSSDSSSDEDEMLDLYFDPTLNCYFDPDSKIYYELK